jgi:Zn-dependent protease/predicted transcriptional regulator
MPRKQSQENRLRLFQIFGFTIYIDPSWIFIALLVVWTLAVGFFPFYHEGLPSQTYWVMGTFGAIGLFASIIFHEFWHSYVARRFGLPMKGITLFIFGGIAEMEEEPPRPGVEFWVAIAGPIASIILGALFYLVYQWGEGWPVPVTAVLGYLAFINWLLAAFNMVPAFPLDGGRILRSALWRWKGDLRWATHKASRFGAGFGFVLIALGIISLFAGNLIGGFWYIILGLFLRAAAQMAYKQVLIRETFEDVPVRNLMIQNPVTVTPDLSLQNLVEDYIYRYHFKMFPVVRGDGRLVGCVSTRTVKSTPKEEWGYRSVGSVLGDCGEENTISPDRTVTDALAAMNRSGSSRMMVVENGTLVGIIALKDILGALSARLDLEG